MNDETQSESQNDEPEGKRDDGVLTPSEIVAKHKHQAGRTGLMSRSGLKRRVRTDLAAYHEARNWGEPDDEKVDELIREILA